MVYCTCAFAPEENELVLDAQLRKSSAKFIVQDLELPISTVLPGLTQWQDRRLNEQCRLARRVLPQPAMDAFFLCKLLKTED